MIVVSTADDLVSHFHPNVRIRGNFIDVFVKDLSLGSMRGGMHADSHLQRLGRKVFFRLSTGFSTSILSPLGATACVLSRPTFWNVLLRICSNIFGACKGFTDPGPIAFHQLWPNPFAGLLPVFSAFKRAGGCMLSTWQKPTLVSSPTLA
jgi:hypothetical protein